MAKNMSVNQNEPPDSTRGAILASIALPGIVGNVVAIIITVHILKLKDQQLSPNVFVLGLTCIDLIAVLGTAPSLICYAAGGWVGGESLCRFQGFIALFCSLASGGIAVAMAVDRYISVSYPFWYRAKMGVSLARKAVIAVITSAAALSLMPVGGIGGFIKTLSGTFCTFDWFSREVKDTVFSYVILVYSGALILTLVFCNITVIVRLFQNTKKKKTMSVRSDQDNLSSGNSIEWQLGRMMIVISTIFLLCWIPFTVRVICNLTGVWPSEKADVQALRLALLNFVLDPFTYVLTRNQYRHALRDMCCKTRRQRFESVSMSSTIQRTSTVLQDIGAEASDKTHQSAADKCTLKPNYNGDRSDNIDCVNNGMNIMTALTRDCFSSDATVGSLGATESRRKSPDNSRRETLLAIDVRALECDALAMRSETNFNCNPE